MAKIKASIAIQRIKSAGHDISDEYSTERCIEFINNSIQQVSSLLIAAKWPSLVKEVLVGNGDTLPDNFMQAVGTYPIRMTDGTVAIIDDDFETVRFRYFATPSNILNENDMLPFNHDGVNEVIIRGAILLALNENEYELSQDKVLLDTLQQAIASGMS